MPETAASGHYPVLQAEVLDGLKIMPGGIYVDATLGRCGHSRAILQRLGPHGRLIALDRDPEAIEFATNRIGNDPRLMLICAPFSSLTSEIFRRFGEIRVDGILLDLGVSSPQLDNAARGFSFLRDGPLDMRMGQQGQTASQWLSEVAEKDLLRIVRQLGEERFARRIAAAIVEARNRQPIVTTKQLSDIIVAATPIRDPHKHPATRTFQAIRMYINHELDELRSVLPQAIEMLRRGGRLVLISFHSLEDRICKRFLRSRARGDDFPPDLPVPADALTADIRLVGKLIRPTTEEIEKNIRSRSAIMRIAEKL